MSGNLNLRDFRPDLSTPSPFFWSLLGEAKSKCEHISSAPLLPEARDRLHAMYLAKGVQATTAIEGNSLNLEEVDAIIAGKLRMPPSKQYLEIEINNVIRAIGRIVNDDANPKLSVDLLCSYNGQLLANLKLRDDVVPGALREIKVGVGRYRCPLPQDVPEMVDALVKWYNDFPVAFGEGMEIHTAIVKAILAHLYLVLVHPFGDGNGRSARLLEWQVLRCAGVPTAATHLMSNFYNQTRDEYYRQLDKVSTTGIVMDFLFYAIRGFVDQLEAQLVVIQEQQISLTFLRRVEDTFKNNNGRTALRRRNLAVAIAAAKEPVRASGAPTLSVELGVAYAGKTAKTIVRDLNALKQADLIHFDPQKRGYMALVDSRTFAHQKQGVGADKIAS